MYLWKKEDEKILPNSEDDGMSIKEVWFYNLDREEQEWSLSSSFSHH